MITAVRPRPVWRAWEPHAATENAVTVDATLEAVVRRDRLVVVAALAAVIVLSWAYLLASGGMGMAAFEMTRMSQVGMAGGMAGMAMMAPAVWTPGYAVAVFLQWGFDRTGILSPKTVPTRRSTKFPRPPTPAATTSCRRAARSGLPSRCRRRRRAEVVLKPRHVGSGRFWVSDLRRARPDTEPARAGVAVAHTVDPLNPPSIVGRRRAETGSAVPGRCDSSNSTSPSRLGQRLRRRCSPDP